MPLLRRPTASRCCPRSLWTWRRMRTRLGGARFACSHRCCEESSSRREKKTMEWSLVCTRPIETLSVCHVARKRCYVVASWGLVGAGAARLDQRARQLGVQARTPGHACVCALSVIRREGGTLTLGEKRVRACVCVPQAAERALRRLQVERRFPTSNDNLLELRVSFLTRISRSRG